VKRDPRQDPNSDDRLIYGDWEIKVVKRDGPVVHYSRRKRPGGEFEPVTWQTIEKWTAWSGEARVKQRGVSDGECVVMTTVANARCSVCGERVECPHSVGLAFYCEAHCVAHKEAA
jgi:hypothetical protein